MSKSRVAQLSELIATNVAKLEGYWKSHNLPFPSFDVDGPVDMNLSTDSPEIEAARMVAIEASMELQDLLQGPTASLRPIMNASSLQAIYRFEIATKIPLQGDISYEELAKLCQVHEQDLRRILRFSMAFHRIFREPRKGFVAHTAASRQLAENPNLRDTLGMWYEDCWPSMVQTLNAMQRFPGQEPNQTGFSLANSTEDSMFDYLGKHPARAKRFANAMKATTAGQLDTPMSGTKAFSWASIGSGTVVDVGGSEGHASMELAEAFPSLSFIVQDRPEVISGAQSKVPPSLQSRVSFMAHDFFTEQPVKADCYLFRRIFHNWPDAYCVRILRNLIPALQPGARIVINDNVMPEPNTVGLLAERKIRATDMLMLSLFNSRERESDDWMSLFHQADSRFIFVDAVAIQGSTSGIIEAIWNP